MSLLKYLMKWLHRRLHLFEPWIYENFYSTNDIDLPRFKKKDLCESLKSARVRFPKSPIYLLSDCVSRFNGTVKVDNINDVEKHPPPVVFLLVFTNDQRLIQVLNDISHKNDYFYYLPRRAHPPSQYFHRNVLAQQVLRKIHSLCLDRYDLRDFQNIIQVLEATRNTPGSYVEVGVYKGNSAVLACEYMNTANINRNAYFIDLFQGISNESARNSPDAFWYGTHTDAVQEDVRSLLCKYDFAHVIRADITKWRIPEYITPITICNLDCDVYEAIISGLYKLSKFIVTGGVIIVEDAGHTPLLGGALQALCQFIESEEGTHYIPLQMESGQTLLIRIK